MIFKFYICNLIISFLYICVVNIKLNIIFETPDKFIIVKLSIRTLVSFVTINLCGVSTRLYFSLITVLRMCHRYSRP